MTPQEIADRIRELMRERDIPIHQALAILTAPGGEVYEVDNNVVDRGVQIAEADLAAEQGEADRFERDADRDAQRAADGDAEPTDDERVQDRRDEAFAAAEAGDQDTFNQLVTDLAVDLANQRPPEYVTQQLGRDLSPEDYEVLIEAWNELYGDTSPVESREELVTYFADARRMQQAVAYAFDGETTTYIEVRAGQTPDGRPRVVRIPQDMAATITALDVGEKQMGRLVSAVAQAWDTDDPTELGELAVAVSAVLRGRNKGDDGTDKLEDRDVVRGAGVLDREQATTRFGDGTRTSARERRETIAGNRAHNVAWELRRHLRDFNNMTGLALLAASGEEELARTIYARGFATPTEARTVRVKLQRLGYSAENFGALYDPMEAALIGADGGGGGGSGGSGGGGGREITLPDPAQVDESTRSLFRAWFQRDPSPGELASFRGAVEGAVRASYGDVGAGVPGGEGNYLQGIDPVDATEQPGTTFRTAVDPNQVLLDRARSTAEYGQLFGRKPGNMSEEEWAQQFQRGAQTLLGAQGTGAADAIRAGMQTGDFQTTLGAVQGSKSLTEQNSTWQERLAIAAQAIARMT
ncbi:MAG TPA: hypothetical protein VD926_06375 [Acidimicrobiales bacterium]|nr:hypothetical protein [Acidimicrobiales bacterium]